MQRRVLVTGAGGFIGRRTCAALVAAGHRVRAANRHRAGVPHGCEQAIVSDICNVTELRAACEGVDSVVHLAAATHAPDTEEAEYVRVNIAGTTALLQAANEARVRRFVFMSSVKAGADSAAIRLNENTPARPADAYGRSKLAAERLVANAGDIYGMSTTVVRIPMTYGPGMKGNILALFRLVERGVPLPVGRVRNRRSLVFVENVAAAVAALLDCESVHRELFYVADAAPMSTEDIVREIARALRRRARIIPAPVAALRAVGRIADAAGPRVSARFGTAFVERLLGSLEVDASKITRLSGFRPPFTTAAGMVETASWYRQIRAAR